MSEIIKSERTYTHNSAIPDSKIPRITELALTKSSRMIADILGVSRNTVIGFCHRRGTKMLGNATAFQITKKPKDEKPSNIIKLPRGRKPKPKPEKKPDGRHHKTTVNVNKSCAPLPIETVINGCRLPFPPAEGRCRSIVGEARDLICCGNECVGSWCEAHKKIYFQPMTPKKVGWYG